MNPSHIVIASLIALSAAGCKQQRFDTGFYPSSVEARHPIQLVDAPRSLPVYPSKGRGLDQRQSADIAEFARAYRADNRAGGVTIRVPAAAADADPVTRQTVASIRSELTRNGVPVQAITQVSYDDAGLTSVAPVYLSFRALTAAIPHQCGQWPFDLAGGGGGGGQLSQATVDNEWWSNEPYWNFGCAYQSNIAAQVLDPLDLQRPRTAAAGDAAKRVNDIRALREGRDPSTTYAAEAMSVKDAGAE